MAETINTQTTGYECVGIEKIEQTYEGLFDNKPNIITIYLTNGDTHQFKVMNGSQGVGIDRIEQRQSSTTNGGRNEFAIILTNGKEYTFSTYNGSGGSGSSGSFNQVLQHLNNLLMPSGKSYLYYNGSGFEWKSPDGSTGGGTTDLSEYSWWGRKFDPASKSITGEMSGVTGIEFQSTNGETVIRKKLHLDKNGDLCFDGNFYATGGITALGSGGGTSGGSGGSTTGGIRIKRNGSTLKDSNGNVLSCTSINFKYGENWNSTPILINSDNEISVDLSVVANNGNGGSSSNPYPLTIYNGSSNTDYITYDGSSSAYLKFKSGFSVSKVGLGYEISVSGGGSGVTLNPTMDAMNKHLDKTAYGTPQFLYWDGSTYTWKDESEIGGSGGSIQVAKEAEQGYSEQWHDATKLRFVGIGGTQITVSPNSIKNCVDVGIPTDGGSGRIKKIKLFNSNSDYSFETIDLGTADTIGFMAGNNVTLEAVVKEYVNVIKISATGGSSTGGGSVDLSSYLTKTEASITYAAKSHSHSVSDIPDFTENVKTTKVNNATNADKATQLANPRLIWGQSFSGTGDINGNLKMGSAGGDSIQLWMNNGNMLDRKGNALHIGYGLKELSNGWILLDAYATRVYTSNYSNHYDFKGNVFDVNSNNIHFGSETNGGKISWDAANNAFKIEGNIFATGGITALGVSNSATTSNNVDFTFKSVTANTFNVIDSIQLSDGLKLSRNVGDIDLVSINGNVYSLYLDGEAESYYLSSDGNAYFSTLSCEVFNFSGANDFKIVDSNNTGFSIQFTFGGKTYTFTPSESSVTVS